MNYHSREDIETYILRAMPLRNQLFSSVSSLTVIADSPGAANDRGASWALSSPLRLTPPGAPAPLSLMLTSPGEGRGKARFSRRATSSFQLYQTRIRCASRCLRLRVPWGERKRVREKCASSACTCVELLRQGAGTQWVFITWRDACAENCPREKRCFEILTSPLYLGK
jgi:hypothetical protein